MTKKIEKSLRDLILESNDLPIVKIPVPEWNTDLYMRSMTVAERNSFMEKYGEKAVGNKDEVLKDFDVKLLVRCLYEDKDCKNLVFKDSDASKLKKKSSVVINRCLQEANKLNALGTDNDALEKN